MRENIWAIFVYIAANVRITGKCLNVWNFEYESHIHPILNTSLTHVYHLAVSKPPTPPYPSVCLLTSPVETKLMTTSWGLFCRTWPSCIRGNFPSSDSTTRLSKAPVTTQHILNIADTDYCSALIFVLIQYNIQSSGLLKALYTLLPGKPVQSNTILTSHCN